MISTGRSRRSRALVVQRDGTGQRGDGNHTAPYPWFADLLLVRGDNTISYVLLNTPRAMGTRAVSQSEPARDLVDLVDGKFTKLTKCSGRVRARFPKANRRAIW